MTSETAKTTRVSTAFWSANLLTLLEILFAFKCQRWCHLVVFILAIISWFTSLPSQVPEHEEGEEDSVYKISLRDVRKGSFGKICDTIGMFLYQAAVFLA